MGKFYGPRVATLPNVAAQYGAYLRMRGYAEEVVEEFIKIYSAPLVPIAEKYKGNHATAQLKESHPVVLGSNWRVLPSQNWCKMLFIRCGQSTNNRLPYKIYKPTDPDAPKPIFPPTWTPTKPRVWVRCEWDERYEVSDNLLLRRVDGTPVGIMPLTRYLDLIGVYRTWGLHTAVNGAFTKGTELRPPPPGEYFWAKLISDICVTGEYLNHCPVMMTALPLTEQEPTSRRMLMSVLGAQAFIRDEIGLMMFQLNACPAKRADARRTQNDSFFAPHLYMLMVLPEVPAPIGQVTLNAWVHHSRELNPYRPKHFTYDELLKDTAREMQMRANRRYSAILHYAKAQKKADYLKYIVGKPNSAELTIQQRAAEVVLAAYSSNQYLGDNTLRSINLKGSMFEHFRTPIDLDDALIKLLETPGPQNFDEALNELISAVERSNAIPIEGTSDASSFDEETPVVMDHFLENVDASNPT